MIKKISTIVLTKNSRLNMILRSYIEDAQCFEILENFEDISEVYNTISSIANVMLIVDMQDYELSCFQSIVTDFPACKLIVIKENPDVNFVVKAVRAGARDILAYPVIKSEFISMLENVKSLFEKDRFKKDKCKMITVFSNKGGCGKTSVAANLAFELAKITKENIALVDLNFQFGDITTILDIKPSYDISYMIKNLKSLNKDFLLSTMERYKQTSLFVLADPPYFCQTEAVSAKQILNLFEHLKEAFSYIVVDTATGIDDKTIAALECSDLLFLPVTMNLPALRNCQRTLDLFDKLAYDEKKVQVIVNRYMENDELKIEDAEKLLKKNIYWKIPNNYFSMMAAINKGIFIAEYNSESNVARSYKEFAMQVSDSVFRSNLIKKFSSGNMNIFRS